MPPVGGFHPRHGRDLVRRITKRSKALALLFLLAEPTCKGTSTRHGAKTILEFLVKTQLIFLDEINIISNCIKQQKRNGVFSFSVPFALYPRCSLKLYPIIFRHVHAVLVENDRPLKPSVLDLCLYRDASLRRKLKGGVDGAGKRRKDTHRLSVAL